MPWISWFSHRWRTQRNAICHANCRIQWIIEFLNANCGLGTVPRPRFREYRFFFSNIYTWLTPCIELVERWESAFFNKGSLLKTSGVSYCSIFNDWAWSLEGIYSCPYPVPWLWISLLIMEVYACLGFQAASVDDDASITLRSDMMLSAHHE